MESGHKGFDRQTNMVGTGNIIASTQLSSHVRGRLCTECNGFTQEPGHLRDFDLRPWLDNRSLHRHVQKFVLAETEKLGDHGVWLYQFHHQAGDGNRVIHGYVVTDYEHNLLRTFVTGPTSKSGLVVEECSMYVAND